MKRFLGLGSSRDGHRIIISCEKLERRVALMEGKSLEEYGIERTGHKSIVGSVYKGRVKNIEPALNAMFVDIGLDKNAFLHFWDAVPAALDSSLEEIKRATPTNKKKKRLSWKDIPSIYPVGSEVIVQVTKGAIGTKGPRVTTNISLPGRFMVLMPLNDQFGISRKIEDPAERNRLRKIMEKLRVPEGMGIIMRTVCQGKRARYFVRDLRILLDQWAAVEQKSVEGAAPICLFEEPDIIECTVRDFLTDDIGEVLCDDEETTERMRALVGAISRRSKRRVSFYQGKQPIFEKYCIHQQINEAFSRQVWLPCGGYIVIDETEALISVDVNTGRNKGSKDDAAKMEKMILQTNSEAAEEVARQLRLRNIGGLVVVDFIDMKSNKDRTTVYNRMRDRLRKDRAKTQVLPISQLGLMEMTRQRLNESLTESVLDPCPYCNGKGMVKSTLTMSVELQRSLHGILQKQQSSCDLIIILHPDVLNRLRTEDGQLLVDLERRYASRLTFRSDPTYHREQVKILDASTNAEMQV